MAYDFHKWVENEGLNRRTPWLRRVYAAPFLLFPASIAIELGDGFGSAWVAILGPLFGVAGVVCAFAVAGSPFLRDTWRSWKSAPVLDEHERLVIAQAQAKSYAVLAAAIMAALLYSQLARGFGWWLPRAADLNELYLPVIVMIGILPIVIAEWTVPLPPADDEE